MAAHPPANANPNSHLGVSCLVADFYIYLVFFYLFIVLFVLGGEWVKHLFLNHLVGVCRSAKGAIHVWNLNTRRADKIVEGHSGNSVIWVSTLHTSDTLIR